MPPCSFHYKTAQHRILTDFPMLFYIFSVLTFSQKKNPATITVQGVHYFVRDPPMLFLRNFVKRGAAVFSPPGF